MNELIDFYNVLTNARMRKSEKVNANGHKMKKLFSERERDRTFLAVNAKKKRDSLKH